MKKNDRHLTSDQNLIDQLQKVFQLVHRDNANWRITYRDDKNGDQWLYFRTDTELQGGGYPIMGKLPLPETDRLIDIALNSDKEDEIFAACRTLVNNEQINSQEFRAALIDQLESKSDKDRRRKIIKFTELNSMTNRKFPIGKSADQIEREAKKYEAIAVRANELLS